MSSQSWYRSARFENEIQNENYKKCQVPDLIRRLTHALAISVSLCLLLLAYFIWSIHAQDKERTFASIWTGLVLIVSLVGLFLASRFGKSQILSTVITQRLNLQVSGLALVFLLAVTNNIAAYRQFTSTLLSWILHILVTLLLYMCIRAPLIVLLVLGIGNSIVFEVLRHIGAGA